MGTTLSPQAKAVQHPVRSHFFEMISFFCTLYPQTSWLRKSEETRDPPTKSWDFGGPKPWNLFWLHYMPPYLAVDTISRKVEFARCGYILPFTVTQSFLQLQILAIFNHWHEYGYWPSYSFFCVYSKWWWTAKHEREAVADIALGNVSAAATDDLDEQLSAPDWNNRQGG